MAKGVEQLTVGMGWESYKRKPGEERRVQADQVPFSWEHKALTPQAVAVVRFSVGCQYTPSACPQSE